MVFQNYAVFPHMTVFENIAFGLRMQKRRRAEIERRRSSGAAELMHIEQLLERYPASSRAASASASPWPARSRSSRTCS